jgi:hypothetical protein
MGGDAHEAELTQARKDLSACVFANSWTITLAAMGPALVWGVRRKTYAPIVGVSVAGSGADYYRAMQCCAGKRDRVEELEAESAADLRSKLDVATLGRLSDD